LETETVDLTITSPPYAYALEYARVHQLSTLLLIMSNSELRELRKRYIGTDRVSLKTEIESFDGFEFAEARVREVLQENHKVGLVLYQYLKDMNTAIGEITRVLREGGICCIIIGNSTIRKTDFSTCDVLTRMCRGHDLTVYRRIERPYYAYRLPRNRAPQSDRIQSDIFIFARKN
jgi:DNA modification methylase